MRMHDTRTLWQATFVGLLALMASGPAQAVDGVIEINQVKAKVGGVTPGDTPLFPVTISQPGSYRLTGNLDVTDASARPPGTLAENTTAILVTAGNVTIDLNGFTIKGPTVCSGSGSTVTCSPTGSGRGIDASGAGQIGVAVMNGTVRGMGQEGVILTGGGGGQVEKVLTQSNGGTAIAASTVANCKANYNGNVGIEATTVTNCTAFFNHGNGIYNAETVANSAADSNGGIGISALTVAGCTANNNGSHGIFANTVTASNANGNHTDGINASAVSASSAFSNGNAGIQAITATGCMAYGNTAAQITAIGIKGLNICGPGYTPCP